MDLSNFIAKYPLFIDRLRDIGYSPNYINQYLKVAQNMIYYGRNFPLLSTYDEIISYICNDLKKTKSSVNLYRILSGRMLSYTEHGVFLPETGKVSRFWGQYNSYSKLKGEFKDLIDIYIKIEHNKNRMKESSIRNNVSCAASLFLFFQEKGKSTLSDVIDIVLINQAFSDGQKRHNSYSATKGISRLLKVCMNSRFKNECRKLWSILPEYPRKHPLYDGLSNEEKETLQKNLDNKKLSLRDRAICKIAYYTGLRTSDIVNLTFEDVSLPDNLIRLKQQKTGELVCIPLLSVVGNALFDYVCHERLKSNNDHIFLNYQHVPASLSPNSAYRSSSKLFAVSNLRQNPPRRKGLHIFRHALATELLSNDVDHYTISTLLGHTSLLSLHPYLDSDIEHLRLCSLDISNYIEVKDPVLRPYKSILSEDLESYRQQLILSNEWSPDTNLTSRSIDNFFSDYPGLDIKDAYIAWSSPNDQECRTPYIERIKQANLFISYCSKEKGRESFILEAQSIPLNKRCILTKEFTSGSKEYLKEFVEHRKLSGRWSNEYNKVLHSFDYFCTNNGYSDKQIDQQIIDCWSLQRDTENIFSRGKRISVLSCFLKYMKRHYNLEYHIEEVPTHAKNMPYVQPPHDFTEDELRNFFYAISHMHSRRNNRLDKMQQLSSPVAFLLLYSSGMRTNEVRNLDREDVDLVHGVINIRKTKGYIEHRIALHPSMKARLKVYDTIIEKFIPNRKTFFPNCEDKPYHYAWLNFNFNNCWYLYNDDPATSYAFRHHYATSNINSWPAHEQEFNKNMLYLSRSMGHTNLDTTMYYYNFTTEQGTEIVESKKETFNDVIPDRGGFYENE